MNVKVVNLSGCISTHNVDSEVTIEDLLDYLNTHSSVLVCDNSIVDGCRKVSDYGEGSVFHVVRSYTGG